MTDIGVGVGEQVVPICFGPVTGRICASLARGEMPNLPIEPFALGRFSGIPAATEALTLHG